jgi:hypothetical protein
MRSLHTLVDLQIINPVKIDCCMFVLLDTVKSICSSLRIQLVFIANVQVPHTPSQQTASPVFSSGSVSAIHFHKKPPPQHPGPETIATPAHDILEKDMEDITRRRGQERQLGLGSITMLGRRRSCRASAVDMGGRNGCINRSQHL